jgi:hypothetical protein
LERGKLVTVAVVRKAPPKRERGALLQANCNLKKKKDGNCKRQ